MFKKAVVFSTIIFIATKFLKAKKAVFLNKMKGKKKIDPRKHTLKEF